MASLKTPSDDSWFIIYSTQLSHLASFVHLGTCELTF
jgi:hypothetical protein